MRDEAFELYQKSVRTAIRENFSRSEHKLPPWLFEALGKIFHHVPTQMPYSVLALYGVSWERRMDTTNFTDRIHAALLLHNGWDIETSCLLYKNMRLAYPRWQVDPNMWRTYTRQQLRDELGPTYGDIVADICSEPTSNPIFGSLLFGELDQPIRRQFGQHVMNFEVHTDIVVDGKLPPRARLALQNCSTEAVRNIGQPLNENLASEMYHRLTGKHLIDPDIDPRTYDYDQAAIRAALRQADCAFDPFRQGQDAIED